MSIDQAPHSGAPGALASVEQTAPGPHRVQSWPRLVADLSDDGTGTLMVNGITRACKAESVPALRAGLIARAVSYATRLGRPVRLDVIEGGTSSPLAVRPEGFVQLVNSEGVIPPADGLLVHEGRCRHCRRLQPVTSQTCVQCQIAEPLRVEVPPHEEDLTAPAQDRTPLGKPLEDAGPAVATAPAPVAAPHSSVSADTPAAIDSPPQSAAGIFRPPATVLELDDEMEATQMRRKPAPALRLTFSTQRSVTASSRVIIGRRPLAKDGREAIVVVSPGRELSREHATIDVDDQGSIVVTDLHAPNGIELLSVTPTRFLSPGEPTTIRNGSKLLLGDIECVVTLA